MQFHLMDQTGHTTIDFDKNGTEVAKAMAKFAELVKRPSEGGKGYTAARRDGQGKLTQIRSFDPAAEEIVFVPPLKGG